MEDGPKGGKKKERKKERKKKRKKERKKERNKNVFLNKLQGYVWCQDDISLADHRLVGPFQFGATGRKKLKYPNVINNK